jgi:hypothetical protein
MPTATNIDDVEYYATEKGRAAAWSKDRAQEREEVIAFEVGCVCRRLRRRRRSFEASSSLRRYGALFARPTLISQSILTHAVAGERIPSHLITSDTQIVHHIGTIVQRLRREYDLKG